MLLIILVGLILFMLWCMLKCSAEAQKLEDKMLKNTIKSKKN